MMPHRADGVFFWVVDICTEFIHAVCSYVGAEKRSD